MLAFYKKYQLALLFLLIPFILLAVRFEDVKGSFALSMYDLTETKGEIIESRITRGNKPRFSFDIQFTYTVNGTKYISNRVGFGY